MNDPMNEQALLESADDLSTNRLAALIHNKYTLLMEVKRLSTKQRTLIDDGQSADLIGLLAVKQRLLANLQKNDRWVAPFRSQDPDARQWATPEHRSVCQETADLCESVFKDVMDLEAYCHDVMDQQNQDTQRQINGAVSAKKAAVAYQGYAAPPQRSQLDLTSGD